MNLDDNETEQNQPESQQIQNPSLGQAVFQDRPLSLIEEDQEIFEQAESLPPLPTLSQGKWLFLSLISKF